MPRRRAHARSFWDNIDKILVLCHREEQQEAHETDPLKQWKLSPTDRASMDKWDDYTEVKEAMFFYTDTVDAPWAIVRPDDEKRARLNTMQHFLTLIPYDEKDRSIVIGTGPEIIDKAAIPHSSATGPHSSAAGRSVRHKQMFAWERSSGTMPQGRKAP